MAGCCTCSVLAGAGWRPRLPELLFQRSRGSEHESMHKVLSCARCRTPTRCLQRASCQRVGCSPHQATRSSKAPGLDKSNGCASPMPKVVERLPHSLFSLAEKLCHRIMSVQMLVQLPHCSWEVRIRPANSHSRGYGLQQYRLGSEVRNHQRCARRVPFGLCVSFIPCRTVMSSRPSPLVRPSTLSAHPSLCRPRAMRRRLCARRTRGARQG